MKRRLPKPSKSKDKPRRSEAVADEIEVLRGENRELRAKVLRLEKALKRQSSGVKKDLKDIKDLANIALENKTLKTALRICPKCKAAMTEKALPFGKLLSCTKCKHTEVKKGE